MEGLGGDLVGGPVDLVVVLLRFFIDDADAGAGGEIVEVVEGDLLPCVGEAAGWGSESPWSQAREAYFSALRVHSSLSRMLRLWLAWVVMTPRWYSKYISSFQVGMSILPSSGLGKV